MALIYEAWEADGPNGEARVDSLRSDAKGLTPTSLELRLAAWRRDRRVVLITRARTDRQSEHMHNLWVRPGYTSATVSA